MTLEVRDKGGLELLSDLERAGAITPTALHLDPNTSFERWQALGSLLGQMHRSTCWILGDWLNFGEAAYGEKYAQAICETDYSLQTLMNYASVARKVPPERRRESLSFSLHALVAKCEPREQEQWLATADDERLTRRELRERMNLPPEVESEHACPRCGYRW